MVHLKTSKLNAIDQACMPSMCTNSFN